MRPYDNYDLMMLGMVIVLIAIPFWFPYEVPAAATFVTAYVGYVIGLLVSRRKRT